MKYKLFKSLAIIASSAFIIGSTGCGKLEDFGNTNVNPLSSTQPITAALLTNAEVFTVSGAAANIRGGLFAQYFSETQYTDASLFQEPKFDFAIYNTGLMDLQRVIDLNSDPATAAAQLNSGSNANQIAIANILKSYIFWTLTDRWGDIPYSEALKGAANLTPVYDKQEDIYKGLLAQLTASIAGFDGGPNAKGDIFFNGDPAAWKKVANSLRMQIALRMSKVYPSSGQLAATEFAAAVADPNGFMTTNDDNVVTAYPSNITAYQHPWFATYDGRSDYAYSKTIYDIVSNMGDGRRAAFGTTGSPFPYGLVRADATTLPTNYATVLATKNDNTPYVVISAASTLLAYAEAIERGWVSGDAKATYEAGVKASFAQWGLSEAAANAVLTGSGNYDTGTGGGTSIGNGAFNAVPGQTAATATKLERLALQQYLAYYPDGVQGWSSWRRTNIPRLVPTVFAVNSGVGIPRRFVYGNTAYQTNPANIAAAVSRLTGGDVMQARVWWDVQ
ncbi:MAG: SusD/RagB family nutrient-binding outer membrane lipoprotein [Ferruginibacter sp.]